MATIGEALMQSVVDLANKAKQADHPSMALEYAQAANQIAEAMAWINDPRQPHGGSTPIARG